MLPPARAVVWVVAGAPGAGKTTTAEELRRRVRPVPALLDKDTLFEGLEAEVLAAHGRPHGEREGPWYDEHVKRHEYAALTAAAGQIRAAGCPAMLVAPFTQAIRDVGAWRAWVTELGGPPVRLVWVRCDPATLRRRIEARGRPKDAPKLTDFEAFVARTRPAEAPPVPHLLIDTSDGAPPVTRQMDERLAAGGV